MVEEKFKNSIAQTKILYIEDDNYIREYINEFLKRFNSNIYLASNAEDGLEIYKKHKPDIMIVDINLPNMSGIELISQIRKNDNFTRIIISTAYTNKEFTLQAIELNITRYLVKPITSKDLIAALQKALDELYKNSTDYSTIDLGEEFFFDIIKEELYKKDEHISLRKKELELLKFFISNRNKSITYRMLEAQVWEDSVMTLDAIRSQIRNIRKKTHSKIVKNISGVGYKLFEND